MKHCMEFDTKIKGAFYSNGRKNGEKQKKIDFARERRDNKAEKRNVVPTDGITRGRNC